MVLPLHFAWNKNVLEFSCVTWSLHDGQRVTTYLHTSGVHCIKWKCQNVVSLFKKTSPIYYNTPSKSFTKRWICSGSRSRRFYFDNNRNPIQRLVHQRLRTFQPAPGGWTFRIGWLHCRLISKYFQLLMQQHIDRYQLKQEEPTNCGTMATDLLASFLASKF